MAAENHPKNVIRVWLSLLITFSHMLNSKLVDGIKCSSSTTKNYTIADEHGHLMDCVDIYKQPAFSHSLLKNHILQKRPSSSPNGFITGNKDDLFKDWKKKGKYCPKGTVPIPRTPIYKDRKVSPPFINHTIRPLIQQEVHEYAQVSLYRGNDPLYGARGGFNAWNPYVEVEGEFSLAQLWILAGEGEERNTIEVGWKVDHSAPYNVTRLFVYWTSDNYQNTGCYNLDCPGFVQVHPSIGPTSLVAPLSTYGWYQYSLRILVFKDTQSGNWWLQANNLTIGYWPAALFTHLAKSADLISWGGEIVNYNPNGRHTATQMGSGHFSEEGYSKAAIIHNLGYVDVNGVIREAENPEQYFSVPACYDLLSDNKFRELGVYFYYGGPGYSP